MSAEKRGTGSPMTRRSGLLPLYGAVMFKLDSMTPKAAQVIRDYVSALRSECAHYRVQARDLRAELERSRHE